MMEPVDFPIVGSFRADPISKISSETSINWHEVIHPFGKKQTALHITPGTNLQTSIGTNPGPVRGLYLFNNVVYACSNSSLYSFDTAYVVSPIGLSVLSTNEGFVRIIANQTQILFCDGVNIFVFTIATNTLANVTPAGVVPADIAYMNGFFILIDKITNRFYISAIDDGTTWNALDFAVVNAAAGFGTGCHAFKGRVYFFTDFLMAAWTGSPAANFPFRADNNVIFQYGLASVGSLREDFDLMFFLSRDRGGLGSVKMVIDAIPVTISTYEVEQLINQQPDLSNAIGLVYKLDGIIFYKLNIGNITLNYNVTMSTSQNKLWHLEEMADGSRHLSNAHVFINGKHFVGDYLSSKLYEYSINYLKNRIESGIGEVIPRTRISRVVSDQAYRNVTIKRIQIDMLQGVGTPGTDNTDMDSLNLHSDSEPFLNMSKSTDGGETYINLGDSSIGRMGNRRYRTLFNVLGIEREWIFKLTCYNAVPAYILGGSMWYKVEKE